MRVLVVDDSPDDREWLVSLLRQARAADEIAQSDSLADAGDLLTAQVFALVIADHTLSDGSGLELAGHPSVVANRTPVIVITGQEEPNQGHVVLGRGAADFLPKDDLTARALGRACAHARVRRQLEGEIEISRQAERSARIASERALAEARRSLARVAALQALTASLSASNTSCEVMQASMQDASIYERARAGAVFELVRSELHLRASFGYDQEEVARWSVFSVTARTPMAEAVARGEIVCVESREQLIERYGPIPARPGSWVLLPLARADQKLGALALRFDEHELPDGAWLDYLKLLGDCLADALTRARLYEDARSAAEQEQRLLAILSHDLRTPLSAISYGIALLRNTDPNQPVLARLARSAQSMSELIRDILNRAAMRHGKEGARVALTDGETVLREQVEELRVAFPRCRIELKLDVVQPEQCDPVRLSQLVSNLVRNAVQHGDPEAAITVRYTTHDHHCELSVHNFGPVIAAEEVPELFNPFARGRKSRGTGLGLFIVHETVDALGGSVEVSSDAGGTTFKLSWPRDCWSERLTALPPRTGAET